MAKAKFNQETRNWYEQLLEGKTLEQKIYSLELAERQKYHYYTDCSNKWTNEEHQEYNSQWNEIIEMLNELYAQKQGVIN